MADNTKRTECVKVCFTERELLDIHRLACRQEVKVSDLIYRLAREWAYGHVAKADRDDAKTEGYRE